MQDLSIIFNNSGEMSFLSTGVSVPRFFPGRLSSRAVALSGSSVLARAATTVKEGRVDSYVRLNGLNVVCVVFHVFMKFWKTEAKSKVLPFSPQRCFNIKV